MIKLNKLQLIVCWVLSLVISYLVIAPIIKATEYHKYKSADGWEWKGFTSRYGELNKDGMLFYRISNKDSDGTVGRIYYYRGSYKKYSLDFDRGRPMFSKYPHERIIAVIILIGA